MAKRRGQHGRAAADPAYRQPAKQAQPGKAAQPGKDVGAQPAKAAQPGKDVGARWRTVAIVMVATALLTLTALACVLSYPSLHTLASQAAVSPAQAKIYPLIFDAMLVIAASAVLALRGAGWLSRTYAWLSLLTLLAALAGGGVVRAAGIAVPRRAAAITAAAIPWALVLIGFGLLVTLLSYARQRRSDGRAVQADTAQPQADTAKPQADTIRSQADTAKPQADAIRSRVARPEADDDEGLGAIAADVTGPDGPGASRHTPGGLTDPAAPAAPAAPASGSRARRSARPADLQLRARVPASRMPPASETSPHEVATSSGTTVPSSAAPADTKPVGRHHASAAAEDTSPGIVHPDTISANTSPGIALPTGGAATPAASPANTSPGIAVPPGGLVPPAADVGEPSDIVPLGSAAAATSQTTPNRARPTVADDAEPPAPPRAEPPELRRPHSSPTPPEG